MLNDLNKSHDMTSRRNWVIAAIAGATMLAAATGAQAGEGQWKHGLKHGGPGYYEPYYVAVPPGHVRYVVPAPVYYASPVTYVPAYPVYAAPAPGLNLNFNIPLR